MTEGAQANGKLEETAEIEEVSDDSSDDYQDVIYSVGLSSLLCILCLPDAMCSLTNSLPLRLLSQSSKHNGQHATYYGRPIAMCECGASSD